MSKFLFALAAIFLPFTSIAQTKCLDIHSEDIFQGKDDFGLSNYNAFILGESHNAPGHEPLKLALIKYLYEQHDVTDVFIEIGNGAAWLYNKYLETGDVSYIKPYTLALGNKPAAITFWEDLYQYNKLLEKKITIRGLDFERGEYLKVMKLIMPEGKERPDPIKEMLSATDGFKLKDIWSTSGGYKNHRIVVEKNRQCCKEYFGANYPLLEKIMFNRNTRSNYYGRDSNMRLNLLEQLKEHNIKKFIYIVGLIHQDTVFHGSFAWELLNDTSYKMKTVRISPCYKDRNKEDYRYLVGWYNYDKNVELLRPLFAELAIPGCDYTVIPAASIKNVDLKSRGDIFILTHVPWPKKKGLGLFRR